jgi:hypothetical protein
MCFYCDCKRAVYETDAPFGLTRHEPDVRKRTNGAKPAKKKPGTPRRLGSH